MLQPEIAIILVVFLAFVLLEIVFTRFFSKPGQTADDAIVEIVSTLSLVLVSQPIALAGGAYLASLAARTPPEYSQGCRSSRRWGCSWCSTT